MANILAFDVGGTKIAGGIVDETGRILEQQVVPSGGSEGRQRVLEQLFALGDRLLQTYPGQVDAVGIGTAGEVDPKLGTITSATQSIPNWTGTALRDAAQHRWLVPCFVDNDGNAAALGEQLFGAGRGCEHFVYICLGTGVGGAVVDQGKLLRGKANYAAALGHMTIAVGGRMCSCGGQGCLEAYASGTALTHRAQEDAICSDSQQLFRMAAEGHAQASLLVAETAYYLGVGLANLVNLFDPEKIVVGGGLAAAGPVLLRPAEEVMNQRVLPGLVDTVEVVEAHLGANAGLVGAAALALLGLDVLPSHASECDCGISAGLSQG